MSTHQERRQELEREISAIKDCFHGIDSLKEEMMKARERFRELAVKWAFSLKLQREFENEIISHLKDAGELGEKLRKGQLSDDKARAESSRLRSNFLEMIDKAHDVGHEALVEQRQGERPPQAPEPLPPGPRVRTAVAVVIPEESSDKPPRAPLPHPKSLENDDIQKNRWGGKSRGHGCRLSIVNLHGMKHTFVFDALLTAEDKFLKPPFIFHLHDSFARSRIRITRTDGIYAVCAEIEANGVFTIGGQFKDRFGVWQSLEYDLAKFAGGQLKEDYP